MTEPIDPNGSAVPNYAGPPSYGTDETPWQIAEEPPRSMGYLDAPRTEVSWQALQAASRHRRPRRLVAYGLVIAAIAAGVTVLVLRSGGDDDPPALAAPNRIGRYEESGDAQQLTETVSANGQSIRLTGTYAKYQLPAGPAAIEVVALSLADLRGAGSTAPDALTSRLLSALVTTTPFPSSAADAAVRCGRDRDIATPLVECAWADRKTAGIARFPAAGSTTVRLAGAARFTDEARAGFDA